MTQPGNSVVLPPARRRRRWVTVLLAVLIFLAGMAAGSGLTVRAAVRRIQHAIHHPEETPQRITEQLQHKLDLNGAQFNQVEQIIARHHAALMDVRREVAPRVERELESTFTEIRAVLSAEQVPKWEKMVHDLRENWMPRAVLATQPARR